MRLIKGYALTVLVVMAGITAFMWIQGPDPLSPRGVDPERRISADDNELDLLARTVHAEAQGEPYEGKVAVAAVILNRVDDPAFPSTIAGVVYEPLAFQVVAKGTIHRPASELSIEAAFEAIHGLDPSNGALYFYNPNRTTNQWIRTRPVITTIGRHIFSS